MNSYFLLFYFFMFLSPFFKYTISSLQTFLAFLQWLFIKLMINLKLDHSHAHHLPCHPTRALIEEPISIHETDRQQLSDNDDQQNDYSVRELNSLKKSQSGQISSVSGKPVNDFESVQLMPIKKKKKPVENLTPQQIYHTDVISSAFKDSKKGLPANIRQLILQKQKLVQDKVYLGISEKGADLLERIYEQIDTKTHLRDQIQQNLVEMMNNIQQGFENDILDGNKYVIHKIIRSKKEDVLANKRRKLTDTKSLTFNTSMTGQNHTVRDSQSYMSEEQQSQHPSQNDFSLNSSETKKAQDFIKKIQKEQVEQRKRRKQEEERKKSLQVRSMQEKRQFEQEIKSERRNYLKRRIEAKKQIKQKQLEIREKMNKDYKQFLKKYKNKTPLFKQKELHFNEVQQEQKKKEQLALQKRKQQKRSINLEEIREHEKKYKQFRQEKSNEKNNEKKLLSGSQTPNIKYFKGRYHDILAEEEIKQKQKEEKQDPKLLRSELIKKRDEYSKSVRENYIPKNDEAKQKQLKQLMQKLQWTEKLKSGKLDPRDRNETGNEYLRRIHELIAELRAKNKLPLIAKTIDYEEFEKSTRPQYKNYLEQSKLHRRKFSIDYSKIADEDLEDAHYRARKLQEKAKKREIYIGGGNFSIDRTLQERKKVEESYLQSIKAKMALLNKFD